MLHLLVDIVFAAYVGLLVSMQQQTNEREVKVRYLRPAPRPVEPQLALRRYGN